METLDAQQATQLSPRVLLSHQTTNPNRSNMVFSVLLCHHAVFPKANNLVAPVFSPCIVSFF